MLEFRNIDIKDKQWINELLKKSDFMGCEYSFANNMAWRRLSNTQICRYKDFYICCAEEGNGIRFTFPAGSGDYREVIEKMGEYAEANNSEFVITGVTNECVVKLREKYGVDAFEVKRCAAYDDYIYNASDLIELKGKKYHNKRNHLKKFYQYSWEFFPITQNDFDECIAFSAMTYNEKNGVDDDSSVAEQYAIHTYFSYFDEFDLKGGVLRVNGKLVAFTIGERLNSNTFCTHIEKANTEYAGVYVAINNEFAKYAAKDFRYINREEDLGIPGLRKAKQSYYPAFMLEKNTLTFNKK